MDLPSLSSKALQPRPPASTVLPLTAGPVIKRPIPHRGFRQPLEAMSTAASANSSLAIAQDPPRSLSDGDFVVPEAAGQLPHLGLDTLGNLIHNVVWAVGRRFGEHSASERLIYYYIHNYLFGRA